MGRWRFVLFVLLGCAGCSSPPATKKDRLALEDDSRPERPVARDDDEEGNPQLGPSIELASADCNATALPASTVSSEYESAFSTPSGAGGTVTDGTYTLTGWSKFEGHAAPQVQKRRQSIVVSGNGTIAEVVSQTDGQGIDRTSWTVSLSRADARIVFTQTCPAPAGAPNALSFSYRAVNADLTLYDLDKDEGSDFVK